MAKLSQQIKSILPKRLTRTQRQLAVKEQERLSAKRKQEFETLKARAEKVQQEKLSNLQSIDDYAEVYQTIDPELQQFFQTPSQLRTSQSQRIAQAKTEVQSKIEQEQKALATEEANYQKSLSELPDINPSERSQFRKDITEDYREAKALHSQRLAGYQEGLAKLESGQDLSVSSIQDYATKKGNVAYDKEVQSSKPRTTITTKTIDENYIQNKLKGLTLESVETIRNATGGESVVEIRSVKGGERIQIVRETDTGKVYITDLEGKNKGERIEGQGLSDKEIQDKITLYKLDTLQKSISDKEAEGKFDIETIEPIKDANIFSTIRGGILTGWEYTKKGLSKVPFPIFTAGSGSTTIPLTEGTKMAGGIITGTAGVVADKTFVGDIKIPLFAGTTGGEIKLRDITDITKTGISSTQQSLALKQLEKLGIKEEFDPIFQKESELEFQKKYGVRIIAGDITQEQAEEEFRTSPELEEISQRYGQAIERRKGGVITSETWALAGLGIAGLGIKLVPETYGELAIESALVYTGVKGLGVVQKAIPSKVIYGSEVLFGGWEGLTALDPTVSGEKRVIAGVMATGVALHLGIKGIKYARGYTIKPTKIPSPKQTLKADNLISREGKLYKITKGGDIQLVDKTIFGKQKVAQIGIEGRRAVVSTRWRNWLKLNPIDYGVRGQQLGKTYYFEGLRSSYVYKTPSAYQKALKLVTTRTGSIFIDGKWVSSGKLSLSQAKSVLRYYAPRVIDITLEQGSVLVTGKTAKAQFTYLTERPIINVDEALGIKTRGGRAIRDVYDIERRIAGTYGDLTKVTQNVRKTTMFATDDGASYNLLRQAGRTQTRYFETSLVKTNEAQQFFNKLDIQLLKGDRVLASLSTKSPYTAQTIESAVYSQQEVPFRRKGTYNQGKTTIIKANGEREVVNIDLTPRWDGIEQARANLPVSKEVKKIVTNQPKPLTFDYIDDAGNVVDDIKDIIKTKNKPVTFDYVDDTGNVVDDLGRELVQETKRDLDISQIQVNPALKQGFIPQLDIKSQIKDILDVSSGVSAGAGISERTALLGLTLVKSNFGSQTKQELKSSLKLNNNLLAGLRTDLKADTELKTLLRQAQTLRQTQSTASALRTSQLSTGLTSPSFNFKAPVQTFKVPATPIIFPFFLPTAKSKAKKKVKEKSLQQQLAYLPDFTARSLGLEPEILSEAQARKRLAKVQTGFELRRGVRIKPNKLLKGIPE